MKIELTDGMTLQEIGYEEIQLYCGQFYFMLFLATEDGKYAPGPVSVNWNLAYICLLEFSERVWKP